VTQGDAPFLAGLRAALGAAAIAMGATFLAFGAAVAEAGLGLGWAMGASWGVYGMAGQLVLLQGVAGPVLPAVAGATAANARFLPMAVAIAPLLGPRRGRRWLALPFIAITPWAAAMRALPNLPEAQRPALVPGLRPGLLRGGRCGHGGGLRPGAAASPRRAGRAALRQSALLRAAAAGDLARPGVRAAVGRGACRGAARAAAAGAWGLPLAGWPPAPRPSCGRGGDGRPRRRCCWPRWPGLGLRAAGLALGGALRGGAPLRAVGAPPSPSRRSPASSRWPSPRRAACWRRCRWPHAWPARAAARRPTRGRARLLPALLAGLAGLSAAWAALG
jgi:hypothetical protein